MIRPGDDIYLAIERGLEAARVQVLCLSPAALESDWVTLERSTVLFRRNPAEVRGRRFIPLLLADCALPDAAGALSLGHKPRPRRGGRLLLAQLSQLEGVAGVEGA